MKTLGIDVGTTSVSALLYDTVNSEVAVSTTVPSNAFIGSGRAWERRQDPGAICEAVRAAVEPALAHPIDGIAVTGQMHGFLVLDVRRQPLSPLMTWQDETAANPFGLPAGIPVFAGLGDSPAAILGSGVPLEESVFLNIGTGGQVSVVVDDYRALPGIDTRLFPAGRYLLVGAGLCSGRAFAILKDLIADVGARVFDRELDDDALYGRMLELADGETSLTCRTTFAGTRTDPGRRGEIANIDESNLRLPDLCRAVLAGIVTELHDYYREMGVCRARLVGSGNGLRRNPALARLAETAFGLPLVLPDREEEACLGAALVAARALQNQGH